MVRCGPEGALPQNGGNRRGLMGNQSVCGPGYVCRRPWADRGHHEVRQCEGLFRHAMLNRFEKKIHDLELTRMISIQMAPQIRLVQHNDTLMAEKIQSSIVNTIPLWKSQMVLALGVVHSGQAARAQREVTNMTNELLRKNAETLKMETIATAKESERGIVDIETLRLSNESLITTFDEVLKIQADGREKRKEAEVELQRLENDLKEKMLEIKR